MIGKVFGVLVTVSFVCAMICGNMTELSESVTSTANAAVELVITMTGSICLWSGVAKVLDKAGFTEFMQKLISPLLKVIYPDAFKKNNGICECACAVCANFLGLGNAALPLGTAAMKKFGENGIKENGRATDDQVMFAVLATVPFQLLPGTLAAMREASGSKAPYEILLPVWICEILTIGFAVTICKIFSKIFK